MDEGRAARIGRWSWAAAGVLLLIASGSAIGAAPFLPLFVVGAWLAWGVQVWLVGALTAQGAARALAIAFPPLLVLALWLLHGPARDISATGWAHVELWRNERTYLTAFDGAQRGRPHTDTQDARLDHGPPLRIAFPWGAGLLDNWRAIVIDPTGLVLRANDGDPAARALFGGHLVRAVRLRGDFYLCQFT